MEWACQTNAACTLDALLAGASAITAVIISSQKNDISTEAAKYGTCRSWGLYGEGLRAAHLPKRVEWACQSNGASMTDAMIGGTCSIGALIIDPSRNGISAFK